MPKNKTRIKRKFRKSMPCGTLFTKDDLYIFIQKQNIQLSEEQITNVHNKFIYRNKIKIAEIEKKLREGMENYRELSHICNRRMTTNFRNLFLEKHPTWETSTPKSNISDPKI